MAASPASPPGLESAPAPGRRCLEPGVPRAMTRCECSGTTFVEIARLIYVEGRSLPEALRGTECGQTFGACLPDLREFLSKQP